MSKYGFLLASLLSLVIGISSASAANHQVVSIHDGDTLTLTTGEKVRLLQIDTPEISPAECYGAEARKILIQIIGKSAITLESDDISGDKDRYGRLLRYVKIRKINVNLRLVEIGAATPYFYNGEKGKYSGQLLKAAQNAKAKKIGLWKACPRTKLDPLKPATTNATNATPVPTISTFINSLCDPNYKECIPKYPPDLDCTEIKKMGLAPIQVIGRDVHKLDGDGDGIGCDK